MKSFGSFVLFMLFIMIAIFPGLSGATGEEADVDVRAAAEMIGLRQGDNSFMVIDVRTSEEFNAGHIDIAVNIDVNSPTFKEEMSGLKRDMTYLVYCRSGKRSKMAQGIMKEMGFHDVINMLGGWIAWGEAVRGEGD